MLFPLLRLWGLWSAIMRISSLICDFFFLPDQPLGLQNHLRLRTPPPPLSHPPNPHHAASINSLNRGNFTPRSNPSPAPTDHSLSGEPPGSVQDPVHAQDNWLLNSNIPLETRYGSVGAGRIAYCFEGCDGRLETGKR